MALEVEGLVVDVDSVWGTVRGVVVELVCDVEGLVVLVWVVLLLAVLV